MTNRAPNWALRVHSCALCSPPLAARRFTNKLRACHPLWGLGPGGYGPGEPVLAHGASVHLFSSLRPDFPTRPTSCGLEFSSPESLGDLYFLTSAQATLLKEICLDHGSEIVSPPATRLYPSMSTLLSSEVLLVFLSSPLPQPEWQLQNARPIAISPTLCPKPCQSCLLQKLLSDSCRVRYDEDRMGDTESQVMGVNCLFCFSKVSW